MAVCNFMLDVGETGLSLTTGNIMIVGEIAAQVDNVQ